MAEKASKTGYTEGIGRRKTSVARVRITPGAKVAFEVNEHPVDEYFTTDMLRMIVRRPLVAEGVADKYHITVHVRGGGIRSQGEAVSLGLARALAARETQLRTVLKKGKLLSSDARQKERRKFGLKKARKSPQWSKR